jgi:5-(carboxyamino)imidazole ribonucleotide mutase
LKVNFKNKVKTRTLTILYNLMFDFLLTKQSIYCYNKTRRIKPSYNFGNMARKSLPDDHLFHQTMRESIFLYILSDIYVQLAAFSHVGEKHTNWTFLFFLTIKEAAMAKVGVIMGSVSDWETMKEACDILDELEVAYEKKVVSAHRTPDLMFQYAEEAEQRGLEVIIAGAGGAAHLPGMVAAKTILPVIGVPVQSKALNGMDSLLSIVQMPKGVPVATVAIGKAGAANAGLLAAQMVAVHDEGVRQRLKQRRAHAQEMAIESSEQLV